MKTTLSYNDTVTFTFNFDVVIDIPGLEDVTVPNIIEEVLRRVEGEKEVLKNAISKAVIDMVLENKK